MDALTCGICLDQLKVPVSTPCGHLCCEACLTSYIEASEDALNASCPTCRASFSIAIPDLRFVPKKYHSLILPSIRRVFISPNAQPAPAPDAAAELRAEVARLTDKIDALVHDKTLLMDRCEAAQRASHAHAQGERDERLAKERLQREMRELRAKYEGLKGKYKTLKAIHTNDTSTKHLHKRTSSQAALDNSFSYGAPSSSSTDSLTLPAVTEQRSSAASGPAGPGQRPILRIPKRPRLLGSPFDLSKRIESRQATATVTMTRRTSMLVDSDEDEDDERGGRGLRASDMSLSSSAGSTSSMGSGPGPQRSGLPTGDIFSPRRSLGGGRNSLFGGGYPGRASARFNAGWLLSPEDA
ncbi:hypothetical protein BV20DRAFT_1020009 [Pilatotrama ljubarskyi]|nr:hypothetical protein BV20DRAFT_1020009 [Pilatotrama ljubarskyi]